MNILIQSPFTPDNIYVEGFNYEKWRSKKLKNALNYSENNLKSSIIDIDNANSPTSTELNRISKSCKKNNFCLYRIKNKENGNKEAIHSLAKHLGLSHLDNNLCADEDSLTSITNTSHEGQHEYIPYTTKRLSWHTDGYYNPPERNINSMLLHCVKPAKSGGESLLLDHDIAYILLRDKNPNYIKALMQENVMTIPANILNGKVIREAQTGPVFSFNSVGQLHMRYSARKRNIEWEQSPITLEAVSFLEDLLESNSKYIIKYALKAGEGLICKNILHRRTAFVDFDETSRKRLLYRGRYFDIISSYKSSKKRGGG